MVLGIFDVGEVGRWRERVVVCIHEKLLGIAIAEVVEADIHGAEGEA